MAPTLKDYRFPGHILTPDRMREALDPARLAYIRASIQRTDEKDSMIQYLAPWSTSGAVEHETLDLVYSQASLEHVDGRSPAATFRTRSTSSATTQPANGTVTGPIRT